MGVILELYLKHKTVILRTLGALMIIVGIFVHFWAAPKEEISEIELAAANVARIEASVASQSGGKVVAKPSMSEYVEELKNAQEMQARYITIIFTILGVGFLGYSFKKKEPEIS